MKTKALIFCTFCILFFSFAISNCNAQAVDSTAIQAKEVFSETDSVQVRRHSPKKASWLALIPGAGQIYNKKYWKLPIVYGGMGTTGYLTYYYGKQSAYYRREYVTRANDIDGKGLYEDLADMSDDNVLALRNYYRRNMEICIAVCVLVYALSIVDASVDAHLFYYDISDNLSMGVKPKVDYNPITRSTTPSLAFVLKF
jgi:hypothetical protein